MYFNLFNCPLNKSLTQPVVVSMPLAAYSLLSLIYSCTMFIYQSQQQIFTVYALLLNYSLSEILSKICAISL